jgi:hypothetical protein
VDLYTKQSLEKAALEDLLREKLNPIGDKALDAKQKTQGRLEGLRQLLDLFTTTAFAAGTAKGYADSFEQLTNEIKNRLAIIDEKYNSLKGEQTTDGLNKQNRKPSKKKKKTNKPIEHPVENNAVKITRNVAQNRVSVRKQYLKKRLKNG